MKLSIVYKVSLFSAILVMLTVSVVAGIFYNNSVRVLVDHALEDMSLQLGYSGNRLINHIEAQRNNVELLSYTPPIQGILRANKAGGYDAEGNSSYEQWTQRLANIFQGVLVSQSGILQLRFIDAAGLERVRVVRDSGSIVVTGKNELQDKSNTSYVRNTLKQKKGSIYLSEINLNREYGEVVKPHQEIIRISIPVYDESNGDISGMVILNTEVGHIFQSIQRQIKTSGRDIFITNDRGGYLLHPDRNKAYGFDLGKRYRIQEDTPAIAKLYLPDNTDTRLILFPEQTYNKSVLVLNKISFDSSRPGRFIAVGVTESYDNIVETETRVLGRAIGWSIVLVIIGTASAILLSIRITRPIKQITDVIEQFKNEGMVRKDMPVGRQDEVGVLAREFQSMVSQVEEAQDGLRMMNRSLDEKVNKRTKELESSEIRQRSIVDNMVDGLIVIDDMGMIHDFNRAAETIFGYQSGEVIGKNINILMPEPYHSEHDDYLRNYINSGEKKVIGIGREVEGKRKDGGVFPLDLAVNELFLDGKRVFIGVVRDITERKYVDKMKSEFISTVSHELRTPITSIRGSLGLINGGAVGEIPEEAKAMLKIAGNNTERLLLLINDILDIQKIEFGEIAFKFQALTVMPFLRQAIEDNAAYGDQQGVTFAITNEIEDISIYADKDRMMQVMANLLSNAAKFSPEGEVVEINVARHHGGVIRISVTDHGPGIPEEFQPKLFDRFTQSDSSDSRQEGGTGLGLSITRVIVEKHGGLINFVSHEGVGSTFYIELPVLADELEGSEEYFPGDVVMSTESCVLIVEDDHDIAALIKRMLAVAGFNSDVAYDISGAKSLLKHNVGQYQAITLDLVFPGENGISFLEELRKDPEMHDIPIVVVSVTADEARRDLQGRVLDVIDWLQKPIDFERLINVIKRVAIPGRLPRVLHVEDESDVRQVVAQVLKDQCEIVCVDTIESAKKALQEHAFDLVLLDVGLPDGSGLDLLELIEKRVRPPRVVIFSAYDVADEYVSKVSAVLMKSKTSNLDLANVISNVIHERVCHGSGLVG